MQTFSIILGKKYHDGLLILLFTGLIIVPFFFMLTAYPKPSENFENRSMAKMPRLPDIRDAGKMEFYFNLAAYSDGMSLYINDNFPFRNTLFRIFRDIKMKLFKVSPVPDRVILAENGWLFIGNQNGNVLREALGIDVFTEEEVNKCAENIIKLDRRIEQGGSKIYFSIAPEKATIMGNYLPIKKKQGPTKSQQLISVLNDRGFEIIDMKEGFRSLPNIRLYHKTDSHWNKAGAFLGYAAIMKRIQHDFPEIVPLTMDDFVIDTVITQVKDLSKMIQLKMDEHEIRFNMKFKPQVVKVDSKLQVPFDYHKPRAYERRYVCKGKPGKVILFGDSFAVEMMYFFANTFGETININFKIDENVIASEKPDIVISESAERNLDDFLEVK